MTCEFREELVLVLPRLRRFAYALTGSLEDGDDLVQDTCIRAMDRADRWTQGTRIDSWMYRIAQNIWIDKMRSEKVRRNSRHVIELEKNTAIGDGQKIVEHHLTLNEVQEGMMALPEQQRLIVTLVCIEGHSYKETAEITGIAIGTVMSRLARARKTLHCRIYGNTKD